MEWYHVYLFTRLDALNELIKAITTLSSLLVIVVGVCWCIAHCNRANSTPGGSYYTGWTTWIDNWKTLMKYFGTTWVVAVFLAVAVPTQKEVAAIFLLPKMANSETAKELSGVPKDTAKLLRLKLEGYIQELEGSAKAAVPAAK